MASEIADAARQAEAQYIRQTEGRSIDPLGFAMVAPTKEYEDAVMSAPVNRLGDTSPMQDPHTGEFYFMLDVDDIDSGAPLA